MLKKVSVLIIILNILLSLIVGINKVAALEVTASNDGVSGGGAKGTCNSINCWSIGTSGVRIALIDSTTGKVVDGAIEDYWFFTDPSEQYYQSFYEAAKGTVVRFTSKNLKQDLKERGFEIQLTDNNVHLKSINNVAPNIMGDRNSGSLESMTWEYNGNYVKGDAGYNTRLPNSSNTIMNRIMANLKGQKYQNEEDYGTNKYDYINKILYDLTNNDEFKISDNKKLSGKYILQFEPLISWAHRYVDGTNSSYVFYGTVSEFIYLHKNISSSTLPNSVFVSNDNALTYFKQANVGLIAPKQDAIPKINNSYIFNSISQKPDSLDKFYSNWTTAYGVGFINLADYGEDDCSRAVINSIDNGTFDKDKATISTKYNVKNDWITKYKDYGISNLSSLKNYLNSKNDKSCPIPSCNETASNYLSSGTSKQGLVNILSSNTIKKLFSELKKSLANDEIFIYQTYTLGGSYYSNKYCNIVKCSTLLAGHTDDEVYIERLYDLFPQFTALSKELRDAMGGTLAPSCSSTPSCPVPVVTASCEGSNSFTLSDTNLEEDQAKVDPNERCLQNGYAYNKTDSNGNVIASTVQTSYDKEYGDKGYCWESVTFNFPTSVKNGIAGEVFKWGIYGNSFEERQNNSFGTMTVRRICYLDSNYFNGDKTTISSDWASVESLGGKINPKITINYTEAVPSNSDYVAKEVIGTLNVSLSKFDMYINGQINDYGTDNNHVTYTDSNENYNKVDYVKNNPRTYTCSKSGDSDNKCSKVKYVEMIAEYNLNYGNEFKWYASVGTNSQYQYDKQNKKSAMTEATDGYEFMGYGLPTSFVTPTNLKDRPNYSYGYSLQSDNKNGELYATVDQIGTKTSTGYHFGKMLKFAINDDDENNDKIVYSCGFNIKNDMFGYEDGDDPCPDGKCDEEPKGIDVVFRTIELINDEEEISKAFPGMSGNGREKGANWAKLTNDQIVQILNTSIYNKKEDEHMYHITLNVATIQKIRQWNKNAREHGIDPYTDMTSLTDEQNKDDGNDSYGHTGYVFINHEKDGEIDGKNVMSRFLGQLYRDGDLKTICFTSSGTVTNHKYKCQQ